MICDKAYSRIVFDNYRFISPDIFHPYSMLASIAFEIHAVSRVARSVQCLMEESARSGGRVMIRRRRETETFLTRLPRSTLASAASQELRAENIVTKRNVSMWTA